jgi:hypothetical protein
MDLPGDVGGEPQAGFGVTVAPGLQDDVLIDGSKAGLIEKFNEDSLLRLEDGIHALGRYLRPLRDRLDGHSGIAFALQEPQGGFDDASAGVACLALANHRYFSQCSRSPFASIARYRSFR